MKKLGFLAKRRNEKMCAQANDLYDAGRVREAQQMFVDAMEQIPEPRSEYYETGWILGTLGDIHFVAGSYELAATCLADAMHCPEVIGNPFYHLRLGQARYELGEMDKAADELMRAYMGAGGEIFEEEDPKYLEFLKTRAVIE